MMSMLKGMFRFKNLAEVPFEKRRTILDDNSPIFHKANDENNPNRSKFITEIKLNLAPSIVSNKLVHSE